MKIIRFILIVLLVLPIFSCSRRMEETYLIPFPDHMIRGKGFLKGMPVPELSFSASYQASSRDSIRIMDAFYRTFPVQSMDAVRYPFTFRVGEMKGVDESYMLNVTANGVHVEAPSASGAFYAIQTISQLLSSDGLPLCTIEDEPRFGYRGLMLDVSRNFFSKDFVKRQLDRLSRYKINRLHLHLTDAAGWRLCIDRYPELTEQAGWRLGETWEDWREYGYRYLEEGHPDASGGYYTKEDLKEIISYAADRFITVIPEIEMPSHSEEVLTVYPEYSCTHEPYRQSDFCPGNEKVYDFLEDVLDEVIEIFPSEYIHIGGDEASRQSWKKCPLCRKKMSDEGLENVDELQTYFMNRMIRYVKSKGRIPVGWDEIYVEGHLDKSAAVMVWRSESTGLDAAKEGYQVIMTPGAFCYLDTYQDAPYALPPAMGGYLPLRTVYSYNPVPDTLSEDIVSRFSGIQGNLWTEYVPEESHAELMIYPRILAIAETGWTKPGNKSYERFHYAVVRETKDMRSQGYSPFDIEREIGDRPEYKEKIRHKAIGCPVHYNAIYYPDYSAGGDTALVDGYRGNWTYHDQRWQGLIRKDRLDVVIDLGSEIPVTEIYADFMQVCGPEVYFPSEFTIELSSDNQNFREVYRTELVAKKDNRVSFRRLAWKGDDRCRYVRVRAKASPFGGFVFTDEIVVL